MFAASRLVVYLSISSADLCLWNSPVAACVDRLAMAREKEKRKIG